MLVRKKGLTCSPRKAKMRLKEMDGDGQVVVGGGWMDEWMDGKLESVQGDRWRRDLELGAAVLLVYVPRALVGIHRSAQLQLDTVN